MKYTINFIFAHETKEGQILKVEFSESETLWEEMTGRR